MDVSDTLSTDAAASSQLPPSNQLILVALTDTVLLPGMVMPMVINNPAAAAALQEAARTEQHLAVVMAREPLVEVPSLADLHAIGTEARLLRYVTGRDGSHNAIVQGIGRVRIEAVDNTAPHPVVRVNRIAGPAERGAEIDARLHQLRERAIEVLRLIEQAPPELTATVRSIEQPGTLADFVTGLLDLTPFEKQEILETVALLPRLDRVIARLAYRHEVLRLSHDIGQQTRAAMEGRQREFLLREQLKAIQKELGESDDTSPELDDLKRKLELAEMPEDVALQAKREMRRLERMPEGAAESGMVRSYLEWLTELPWRIKDEAPIDIAEARRVLDADHFGLDKIKRRILEFLAVRKLNPEGRGPILCFVGPPGVGKTSLGQSIARATGRPFVRVSLGGVHDESEIRGHRRTYVGALPGNIVQALRRAGTRNCVMMLDEMDKLGRGFHGDPAAAMLEVLDPEQNSTFRDNYLAVPFDLSKVMFIGTANMLANIRDYTREAGVRNLERQIGALCRYAAMRIAEGNATGVTVTVADLHAI